MPRSLDWTVNEIWREAVRDLRLDNGRLLPFEKIILVNRVTTTIVSEFYPLFIKDYIAEATLTVSSDAATISAVRLAHGFEPHITITSSELTNAICRPLSMQAFQSWRTGSHQNSKSIVYTVMQDSIRFRKGSSLTTYGTVKMQYPAFPSEATAGTDKVDLPDGAPIQLAIVMLKKILEERYSEKPTDYSGQIQRVVSSIFAQYQIMASTEEYEDKVKALS